MSEKIVGRWGQGPMTQAAGYREVLPNHSMLVHFIAEETAIFDSVGDVA